MTKGEMEAAIGSRMIEFQKEQLGRGADSVKVYIVEDMIVIRLEGVLTSSEKELAQSEKGKALIKEIRYQLEEIIRPELELIMEELTGRAIVSLHNDISTNTGERVDIIILDQALRF